MNYDIDGRVNIIKEVAFSCKSLEELSKKTKIPISTLRDTLNKSYAKQLFGKYFLDQLAEHFKKEKAEAQIAARKKDILKIVAVIPSCQSLEELIPLTGLTINRIKGCLRNDYSFLDEKSMQILQTNLKRIQTIARQKAGFSSLPYVDRDPETGRFKSRL